MVHSSTNALSWAWLQYNTRPALSVSWSVLWLHIHHLNEWTMFPEMLIYEAHADHICGAGFPLITGSPDERVIGLWDRQTHTLCRGKEKIKDKERARCMAVTSSWVRERARIWDSELYSLLVCNESKNDGYLQINQTTTSGQTFCVPVVPIHHVAKLIHRCTLTAHCVLQASAILLVSFQLVSLCPLEPALCHMTDINSLGV